MANIKWKNAIINTFNESVKPIYTTSIKTDSQIWGSLTPRIMWRNLTEEQRLEYILYTNPQCEIGSIIEMFVGIGEKNVILFSSPLKGWPKLQEQLQMQYKVINIKETSSDLENYNKVLLINSPKDIVNDIVAEFQGNKLIFLFDPFTWSTKCYCERDSGKGMEENFEICEVCPHEILWGRGNLLTPLEELLADFDEVRTRCDALPKLFIRKFEDEISSSNAKWWYFNYLTEEERKAYTIITPIDQHMCNVKQEHYHLMHKLKDNFKRNLNELEMRFSIFPDSPKRYPTSIKQILSILQKIHVYGGYPAFYERIKPEFGSHVPLEIEIVAMLKFVGCSAMLSVFSGIAFIENILRLKNVNVKATDDYSKMFGVQPWMKVEKIDAVKAIKKYQHSVLFMFWPPKGKGGEEHSDAFYALREFKGDRLIFMGDSENCACNTFFQYLEDNFVSVNTGISVSKVQCLIRRLKSNILLRCLRRNMKASFPVCK